MVTVGLLCMRDYGLRTLRAGSCWGYALGVAVGCGYFILLHVLPNPQAYLAMYNLAFGEARTPPLQSGNPLIWLGSVGETLIGLGLPLDLLVNAQIPIAVLSSLGVAGLLWRHTPADKVLLTLAAGLILSFSLLTRFKHPFYFIQLIPATILIAAAWGRWITQLPWAGSPVRAARFALVWILVGSSLVLVLPALRNDMSADYATTLMQIRQVIPESAVTIGNQLYWFALPDSRYLSWEQLIYYQRYRPGSTLAEAFQALHPDYLILDGHIRAFMADKQADLMPFQQTLFLPRVEMRQFLASQARLITTIPTGTADRLEIYQFH